MGRFTIELNKEMAAVLLRCLGYGSSAISRQEVKIGKDAVIQENIQLIREQVCHRLCETTIDDTLTQRGTTKRHKQEQCK